jgi:hypothetical protein
MPQWPDCGYVFVRLFSSGSSLDVVVWLQGAPKISHRLSESAVTFAG